MFTHYKIRLIILSYTINDFLKNRDRTKVSCGLHCIAHYRFFLLSSITNNFSISSRPTDDIYIMREVISPLDVNDVFTYLYQK